MDFTPLDAVTFLAILKFTCSVLHFDILSVALPRLFLATRLMPVASSCAAMATFSDNVCLSAFSPSICFVASAYCPFIRVFSAVRFWLSRLSESISRI